MRCAREPSKRKSNDLFRENAICKRAKSMSKESSPFSDDDLTADSVISNLQEIVNHVLEERDLPEAAIIELKGFDASAATMEEYMQKRDEIRRMVGDSEFFDRKTELNLGVVSLALKLELCRLAKRMWRKLEKSENDAWSRRI
ncbi:hypothetical protein CAEBREN_20386 [Caenorhabditis brenneri]|uniref:Uncharacterized protein n=1 Tax=Caenorhabditis brenneri TaxID=135651 RepID=G0PLR2_CAEBE|nr:hypothetical protein CAEBREN_20386 [Caenorhabditis brenneri]